MIIDTIRPLLRFGRSTPAALESYERSSADLAAANSCLFTTGSSDRLSVSGRLLSAAHLAVGVVIPLLLVCDSLQALVLLALDGACGVVLGLAMHRWN